MSSKKTEAGRLILFVVLAYAISWIPAIILNKTVGYHEWFETNKMPLFSLPTMYGPALANVLTRIITKEGWGDSMLHLRIRGHRKYYILSGLIILAALFLDGVASVLVSKGDLTKIGAGASVPAVLSVFLSVLATIPLMAFITFGEEFGWRAYMNQKMEPLLGTTGTVIVGGIIWGLWHAELTVEGHNFGTDYPGFPWLGMLYMCIYCTFMGMILMWVTKRTGSVYPAAIMHGFNNFASPTVAAFYSDCFPEDAEANVSQFLIKILPYMVIGVICLVLMLRDKKKPGEAA